MGAGVLIQGISLDDLRELIYECLERKAVNNNPCNMDLEGDELLTRKDAAELLHISLPTLLERTKDGTLTSYRVGSRILYKRSELEASLTPRKFSK
jgi:excisionase family DNA binding protein